MLPLRGILERPSLVKFENLMLFQLDAGFPFRFYFAIAPKDR